MRKPGDQIDRYVVESILGRGGMGEVYEATDTRLGRRVALKLIAAGSDADAGARMLREARAAAAFEHPHAVVVYDVGEHEGATFLAMELVRGAALRSLVGDASVPAGRKLRWLADVARALAAAHRQGIVHRDVKPDNVMIREDGVAKVLDFGIARREARAVDPSAPTEANGTPLATLTEAGVILGTPRYAAPEQLRGEPLDGRADQFAWGVMAYELLSGTMPWGGADSVALLAQMLSAEAPPIAARVAELPEPVAAAVMRALQKRREDRFASMDEVADAVEPFAEAVSSGPVARELAAALPSPKRPTTVLRVVRGTGRVILWLFAAVGALIVGGIALAFTVAWKKGELEVNGNRIGPKMVTVPAIGCTVAKVEGEGVTPLLAEALGRGACARVATRVGVDWKAGASPSLEVTAKLSTEEATITLAVENARAEGKGPTPIDAIAAASAELTKRLQPPPMSDAEIRAWGATDAAGARRIERVWREMLLNLAPNDDQAVKALVASDPGSAWTHLFFALVRPRHTDESRAAIKRGLELCDALPPARAHALRGTLTVLDAKSREHLDEMMRLLRLAYTEAPDDGDVASLYAALAIDVGLQDEGFAVLDRLVERFPNRSVLALHNAIGRGFTRDLERDARYVERVRGILPESMAWEESVAHLTEAHRFDEARAAIAFGRRLGMGGGAADPAGLDASAAKVELSALDARAARALAARLRADPRLTVSTAGALFDAASYMIEGRVADGEAALAREVDRQRSVGTTVSAAGYGFVLSRTRRWLGRPALDAQTLADMEKLVTDFEDFDWSSTRFLAEIAVARAAALPPKDAKKLLAAALDRADAAAARQRDRSAELGSRLAALPLVRAVRGDAAAAKLWMDTERAPYNLRRMLALDAALALEATGKRAEAVAAYEIAMDPRHIETNALAVVIARARAAPLLREGGKPDEAAKLEAELDRAWQKADPTLRDAVKAMK